MDNNSTLYNFFSSISNIGDRQINQSSNELKDINDRNIEGFEKQDQNITIFSNNAIPPIISNNNVISPQKQFVQVKLWNRDLEKCKQFIEKNKGKDNNNKFEQRSTNVDQFIQLSRKNYNPDINKCEFFMKPKENKENWEAFINDPNYKEFLEEYIEFLDIEKEWEINLNKLINFIDENGKNPYRFSKSNEDERKMGEWFALQFEDYSDDIKKCKNQMKYPDIKEKWESFMYRYWFRQ